jgi:phosphoserine phosphatase
MYKALKKERIVYSDVDDSLILWDYQKYPHNLEDLISFTDEYGTWSLLPHKKNIDFLINLKRQGYGIVIWSAAGGEWAEKVTKALGLENVADFVMAKPELCIDDLLDAKRIIKSIVWIDPITGEYKRNT